MRLSEKLASIPSNALVQEINTMLNQAQVSINWYGQRMVSVAGYDDYIEINELAKKYLSADPFDWNSKASLQDRLDCYILWGRVQKLYSDSDEALKRTTLFKYVTVLKEFRPWCRVCAQDPMAIIGEWDFFSKKGTLFEFTPQEFKRLWPSLDPVRERWIGGGQLSTKWMANEEMVKDALNNLQNG